MKRHRPEVKSVLSDPLGCLGISMAIYAGLWTLFCEKTELASWIGFAGCTTYFACGKKKLQGIGSALAVNVSGVLLGDAFHRAWECVGLARGTCRVMCLYFIYDNYPGKNKNPEFYPGSIHRLFYDFCGSGGLENDSSATISGGGHGVYDRSYRRGPAKNIFENSYIPQKKMLK